MGKKAEAENEDDGSKRITVLFNAEDLAAIEAEVESRTEQRGYSVSVSDALRELVREHWGPE